MYRSTVLCLYQADDSVSCSDCGYLSERGRLEVMVVSIGRVPFYAVNIYRSRVRVLPISGTMVKISGLKRLLLVALVLLVCRSNLVGAQEKFRIFDVGAEPAADTANAATFGGLWSKWKPYYPWMPADTCGWDYASTAYWWVIFDGTTVCSNVYGRNLAASARAVMRRTTQLRPFKINTGTIICTRDSARKRVTYVVSVTGSPDTMRSLRNLRLRASMRSVVSRSNLMTVRGAARGNVF